MTAYSTDERTHAESDVSQNLYHASICGAILYSVPTRTPSEIFSHLQHAQLDKFQRSMNVYHQEIIQMRNEYQQTVLHSLTIHKYSYPLVRLVIMRGCDVCAQDDHGYTAAHYAVERDDVEILKALTTRLHSSVKLFPEEQIHSIHQSCSRALTIRENHGLTVFMLACHHESIKCLDYLLELQINDVHLQDNHGDTCLHYAVARRNLLLVDKLIHRCQPNINSGDRQRPSVLDIVHFNREEHPTDRTKEEMIEKILLPHKPLSYCQVRRITTKRKASLDHDESRVAKLACLANDTRTDDSPRPSTDVQ